MTDENVLLDLNDGVATLTLNRPDRLNAVDWDTAVRLIDLLRDMRQRDDVRAAGGRGQVPVSRPGRRLPERLTRRMPKRTRMYRMPMRSYSVNMMKRLQT